MTGLHGRPTAAEPIAAVADFLDGDVRDATASLADSKVNFPARVAANALRMVQRELQADPPRAITATLAGLGVDDAAELAEAIRRGDLDTRADELTSCLRALVSHRLGGGASRVRTRVTRRDR